MGLGRFRPEPPLSLGTYSRNALQPKTCCAARQGFLSVDFRRTCSPCLSGSRAWLSLSTDQHHSRNRQRRDPIRIGILGPSDFWRWIGINDLSLEFGKVRKKTSSSCVMSGRRNNRDVERTARIDRKCGNPNIKDFQSISVCVTTPVSTNRLIATATFSSRPANPCCVNA